MNLQEALQKAEDYLDSPRTQSMIFDFSDLREMLSFIQDLKSKQYKICPSSTLARKSDVLPTRERINRFLNDTDSPVLITEYSTALKLKGGKVIEHELEQFIESTFFHPVILVTFQCSQYLQRLGIKDVRMRQRIYFVGNVESPMPKILLLESEVQKRDGYPYVKGIEQIAAIIEGQACEVVQVETKSTKESLKDSILFIEDETSYYNTLLSFDTLTRRLDRTLFNKSEWKSILKQVKQYGSWSRALIAKRQQYGGGFNFLRRIVSTSKEEALLLFSLLKINADTESPYLRRALNVSSSIDNLLDHLYMDLLEVDTQDPDFSNLYAQRKSILRDLTVQDYRINRYIAFTMQRYFEKSIYYITDNSVREKNAVFEILNQYPEAYSDSDLLSILDSVYPDLYSYLKPYNSGIEPVDTYIQEYKYQKVSNHLKPGFIEKVNDLAKRREFNTWLKPRASIVASLNKENSILYFVDAMGAEFSSYIFERCKQMNLYCDIRYGLCNLPSVTAINKQFVEEFGQKAKDKRELDQIKHKGIEDYNYDSTELPIYLTEELEAINDTMKEIYNNLYSVNQQFEKAFIISDHGASRLAVLNQNPEIWEMTQRAEHSGRCVAADEYDEEIPVYATMENGYYVLANYDRFKGSRKATVEVHGGASLEEVVVPIIEIGKLEPVSISLETRLPIQKQNKKPVILNFFISGKLRRPVVQLFSKKGELKENTLQMDPESNHRYSVKLPATIKKGKYILRISEMGKSLFEKEIQIEPKGMRENELF